MNFELTTLLILGNSYLALLFGIAFATDRGLIPEKIVRHPIVYVLSLGVFASVWAYYTSIGNALTDGYGYLHSRLRSHYSSSSTMVTTPVGHSLAQIPHPLQ